MMNSFIKFEEKRITIFVGNRSTNQVRDPLLWLQVHQSHVSFSQPTYHQRKEEGLHKEKGWRRRLRLKLKTRCKTWDKKGK
jgi:hypothetical protein